MQSPASISAPIVLAIGRPSFPHVLIDGLRAAAGVDHCMVFAFDEERAARWPLGIGNIAIGPELGAAYSEHFHLADPNREAIFGQRSAGRPIVLPSFSRRMYSDSYRKMFFDEAAIVDKVATAVWMEGTCFYVNFYRTAKRGPFESRQAALLADLAPAIGAAVARHCQEDVVAESLTDIATPLQKLEALFASQQPFVRLTAREKEVCVRILSGYGSEAISADLGISLHSTFTYRKRAYEKLGISAQNELFGIALRLMSLPRFMPQPKL